MANRCDLWDLPVTDFAHCRKTPDPFAEARNTVGGEMGPWFEARYPGHCAGCGADFPTGDQIRADGAGGYVAECCGEDEN